MVTYCREHLAAYKVSRAVQFVEALPTTSSGKVMRRELSALDYMKRYGAYDVPYGGQKRYEKDGFKTPSRKLEVHSEFVVKVTMSSPHRT